MLKTLEKKIKHHYSLNDAFLKDYRLAAVELKKKIFEQSDKKILPDYCMGINILYL